MEKFELFNKFNTPVMVVNNNTMESEYRNNAFKRSFSDFTTLNKFAHKLNWDICMLDSSDWELHSPIYQAIRSQESFVTHVIYQNKNNEFSYYDINAVKRRKYTIFFFADVTSNIRYEKLLEEKQSVDLKCQLLDEDIRSLESIKQQAQSQAIKMALINKISNIMRESIDISSILSISRLSGTLIYSKCFFGKLMVGIPFPSIINLFNLNKFPNDNGSSNSPKSPGLNT
jgi:hypothetical protein